VRQTTAVEQPVLDGVPLDAAARLDPRILRAPTPTHLLHDQERAQPEEVRFAPARGAGGADVAIHVEPRAEDRGITDAARDLPRQPASTRSRYVRGSATSSRSGSPASAAPTGPGGGQCSGSVRRFHSSQSSLDRGVLRSSSMVKPMSRAKRCASRPTSRWWSVTSSTFWATSEGVRTPSSAATAPALRRGPCMHEASSCTTPSAFGRPPYPTLVSSGSSSTMFTPAITASSTSAPSVIIRNARSTAVSLPPFRNWCPFAEATTTGLAARTCTAGARPSAKSGLGPARPADAAAPATALVTRNSRRVSLSLIDAVPPPWMIANQPALAAAGRRARGYCGASRAGTSHAVPDATPGTRPFRSPHPVGPDFSSAPTARGRPRTHPPLPPGRGRSAPLQAGHPRGDASRPDPPLPAYGLVSRCRTRASRVRASTTTGSDGSAARRDSRDRS